ASSARPLFEGLWIERAINARTNWERAAEVARDMERYYPENPGALRVAFNADHALAGSAGADSVARLWRPRIRALHESLANAPLDASSMWEFAMLASEAGDTGITRFWRDRMTREYPRDAGTIQQRVFAIFERSRGGDRGALGELDHLYEETGGQSLQLLANAFDLAVKTKDSASIARWG